MNPQITNRLRELQAIGRGNLISYQSAIQQLQHPREGLARDLISEGAGLLAKEVLKVGKARTYGRKLAKGLMERQYKQQVEEITTQYEQRFISWVSQVQSYLSTVSVSGPNVFYPGSSAKLVRRIRQATRYKKLETRINHVLTELERLTGENLVFNNELPKLEQKRKIATKVTPYETLRTLESSLRQFIQSQLGQVTVNWWRERVPLEVQQRVEARRNRRETVWPWHAANRNLHPIHYADFSDYRRIILRDDNWAQVFQRIFGQTSFIETRLGELEPIRHDIAHSREVQSIAADKLRIFSEEIHACIRRA